MWQVKPQEILEALDILNLVSPRSGMPSSDFFLLEAKKDEPSVLKIKVASLAIAQTYVRGEGEWPIKDRYYVHRDQFSPFISIAKELGTDVPFKVTFEEKLTFRHVNRALDFLPYPEVTGYANLPKLDGSTKLEFTDGLADLMEVAASCAASEFANPILSCVYLVPKQTGVELVASNSKVVFNSVAETKLKIKTGIAFPLPLVPVIKSKEMRFIEWYDNYVVCRFRKGVVWHTVSDQAMTDYPLRDIRKFLNEGTGADLKVFSIDAFQFYQMASRFMTYLSSVRREDWVWKIFGKKGESAVTIVTRLQGSAFKEKLRTLQPLTKDFKINMPLNMIEPLVGLISRDDKNKQELVVGIDDQGYNSFIRCKNVRMLIPARIV